MAKPYQFPKRAKFVIITALGSRLGSQVTNQISNWLVESGPEWTSKRLKAYRTAALQLRAGNHQVARDIYQSESIAFHHGSNIPIGPMGKMVDLYTRAQQPAVLRRLETALRAYSALRCSGLTKAQMNKAQKAITSGPTSDPRALQWGVRAMFKMGGQLVKSSPNLRLPDVSRLKPFSSYHRTGQGDPDVLPQAYGKLVTSLLTSCYIPPSLCESNPAEKLRQAFIRSGADSTTPGHISFIQEAGCKARVVAVPNTWCQFIFEPLHLYLDKLIQSLPGSAVHDQNTGAWLLQASQNKQIWCFDLSSATDRFPLSLQTSLLRGMKLEQYADAFEEVSRDWEVHLNRTTSDKWTYEVGQPMGLYGSFPLFHLTHWALLYTLAISLKLNPNDSKLFLVLGDDVVITHEELALAYESIVKDLGVEVSAQKSISSSKLAEFAGFVSLDTNRMRTTFRPYKHIGAKSPFGTVNLIYALGSRIRGVNKWWNDKFDLFTYTRSWRNPDLSPLLSEDEPGGTEPPGLDSHLLGSLAMRISYSCATEFNDSVLDLWRLERYLLLGQKERLNSDGFASKNNNPIGILVPEDDSSRRNAHPPSLMDDPLMRVAQEQKVERTNRFTPKS
jgi:hypothetical protein